MVPLLLMGKLLDALRPECRLVLLGDKDQLASVEAGAVLSDLCDAAELNALRPDAAEAFRRQTGWRVASADARPLSGAVAELTENHRFATAVHIGEFSRAIKELRPEDAPQLAGRIARCDAPDFLTRDIPTGEIEARLKELLRLPVYNEFAMNDLRRLAESGEETNIEHAFGILNSFRLLGAMRSGKRGVEALNAAMMKLLGHHGLHSPGVPLLVTRNDPRTELYNGDIGLVVADRPRPGGGPRPFPEPGAELHSGGAAGTRGGLRHDRAQVAGVRFPQRALRAAGRTGTAPDPRTALHRRHPGGRAGRTLGKRRGHHRGAAKQDRPASPGWPTAARILISAKIRPEQFAFCTFAGYTISGFIR